MRIFLSLLFYFLVIAATAQTPAIHPDIIKKEWKAAWIGPADGNHKAYGVFHFRKGFDLPVKPSKFVVHVSADNRYKLYVNGTQVSTGPARSDLYNWYFESVDIAPYLVPGKNILAALVWNMGAYAPVAQLTSETAFILTADDPAQQKLINTNSSWKVKSSAAFQPTSNDNMQRLHAYFAVGSNDEISGDKYDWGWETANFNDSTWSKAAIVAGGQVNGTGSDNRWTLNPRPIPQMEYTHQEIDGAKGMFPKQIPANTKTSILLHQGFNTVGYPNLVVSGGKGSKVKLTYAESLFDKNGAKGNRNEVEGKEIRGYYDIIHPDGGTNKKYETLWIRTWRFVQLDIETKDEPLTINDLYGMYATYPFKENASFKSNDSSLNKIWEVGWRTARLCAGETYFDCPYYEQLQYEGDTRIQELISLYVSGDDRLMRKAILEFYYSRIAEGMPQGRYPSSRLQIIPPYSLIWISMIYDYLMHKPDEEFVKQFLHPINGVLDWYEKHVDTKTGLIGPLPWWTFVDYTKRFNNGTPPFDETGGNSSVITLGYLYALQHAAFLNSHFKNNYYADKYNTRAARLQKTIYNTCYNKAKGLLADTPEQNSFSQHANSLGVLTGTIPAANAKAVMQKTIDDTSLIPTTFYFRFYLNKALKHAGLGDKYYAQLQPWRDMLQIGLTTFAEMPEPARSDCHAWSACPVYNFLETFCGIEPSSPGFKTVKVEPSLSDLKEVVGRMPHPNGEIQVRLARQGSEGIKGEVQLPIGTPGSFEWKGKTIALKPGKNTINIL